MTVEDDIKVYHECQEKLFKATVARDEAQKVVDQLTKEFNRVTRQVAQDLEVRGAATIPQTGDTQLVYSPEPGVGIGFKVVVSRPASELDSVPLED